MLCRNEEIEKVKHGQMNSFQAVKVEVLKAKRASQVNRYLLCSFSFCS